MTTENKIFALIGFSTLMILFGGIFFLSKQDVEQTKKEQSQFVGEEMVSEGASHVPEGTELKYKSNPPHSGPHYAKTAQAGVYDEAPEDGFLVHSLEHGAVILWYDEKLLKTDIFSLKKIFDKMPGKTIMTPRKGMDMSVGVTSWTRILRLEKIDEQKILEFYNANYNRAPENAPI